MKYYRKNIILEPMATLKIHDENSFFLASSAGELIKVDVDRFELIWLFEKINTFFFLNDEILVLIDKKLKRLSSVDGGVIFEFSIEGSLVRCYFGLNILTREIVGKMKLHRCYDLVGQLLWSNISSWKIDYCSGVLLGFDESIRVGGEYKKIKKVSPATGEDLWIFDFEKELNHIKSLPVPPAYYRSGLQDKVDNKKLYFRMGVFKNWSLACMDLEEVNIKWISENLMVWHFEIVGDDIVICQLGEITIVDKHTGAIKRKSKIDTNNLPFNFERQWCKFVVKNGCIFLTDFNQAIVAIVDMLTGKVVWYDFVPKKEVFRYQIGHPQVTDKLILILDSEGELHVWEKE